MANTDPVEWFQMLDPRQTWSDTFTHGIVEFNGGWIVVKKEFADALVNPHMRVSEVARVESREAAIGFIKLLVEK